MNLNDLLFEVEILEIGQILFEKPERQNATVASWAKKYNMSYDQVHKVWKKAEKKAGKGNWGLIMHIFKRMFTSIKDVDARTIKTKTGGTFDYKVRTKQNIKDVGEPRKGETLAQKRRRIKKTKELTAKIKELKSKPSTPARKERIKKLMDEKKAITSSKQK